MKYMGEETASFPMEGMGSIGPKMQLVLLLEMLAGEALGAAGTEKENCTLKCQRRRKLKQNAQHFKFKVVSSRICGTITSVV